jgi:N-methylhydantoinase B
VEQYAFHNDEGGAGQYRGGKGVVLDYRVTAEEVYLTYATTRSANPPWSLSGGHPGSLNGVSVHRHDGSVENYDMCTRVRVVKGELIRLTTATGGGYGDPGARARADIARDLRNGFITSQQATADYGFEPAKQLA